MLLKILPSSQQSSALLVDWETEFSEVVTKQQSNHWGQDKFIRWGGPRGFWSGVTQVKKCIWVNRGEYWGLGSVTETEWD